MTKSRRERSEHRKRYKRTTVIIAAVVAVVVGAGVGGGIWWSQRDDSVAQVKPGEYVAPEDIATSSPTSKSTSKSKSKSKSSTSSSSSSSSSTSSATSSSASSSASTAPVTSPPGSPTNVQVMSGGRAIVDASLEATMLDSEKVLAPPHGIAGWYAEPGWPKPGHPGASILVGHINQGSNPDVFWNLPNVNIGDLVKVTYGSGKVVKFKITRSEPASKKGVPQDPSIWDHDNPNPVLRLITCDPETPMSGGHYEGNWVVWADQIV